MRLSNRLQKLWSAAAVLIGLALLLFGAYQLYLAAVDGTVWSDLPDPWVTWQSHPGWFVFSVSMYAFVVILGLGLGLGLAVAVLYERRQFGRWRLRPDVDTAIRQTPEER